jgi:hypothetical protein
MTSGSLKVRQRGDSKAGSAVGRTHLYKVVPDTGTSVHQPAFPILRQGSPVDDAGSTITGDTIFRTGLQQHGRQRIKQQQQEEDRRSI